MLPVYFVRFSLSGNFATSFTVAFRAMCLSMPVMGEATLCCAIGLCYAGMFATFVCILRNVTMDKNNFPLTFSCRLQTIHMAFCLQQLSLVVGGIGTSGAECGRLVLNMSNDFCGFARPNMPGGAAH